MSTETAPKTITLADWLKDILARHNGDNADFAVTVAACGDGSGEFLAFLDQGKFITCDSPEDALQALAEAVCGPDVLLDIGRSAAWEKAHGPDGVAGLCEGEAGVVVCRDGALTLIEKVVCQDGEWVRPDPGYPRQYPNTFETGLPFAYPDPPSADRAERLADAMIGHAKRCRATKTAPGLDTDVERGGIRDTLNRVSAWAAEHMGEGTVLQHHTANGILLQLQHGGRTFPDAQTYYDLMRLTPGDFSRQVDEMLAAWERLLEGQKKRT